MDAGEVHYVHAIDGGEVGGVVALEDLLGEVDHVGVGQVEAVADTLEESIDYVVVDY